MLNTDRINYARLAHAQAFFKGRGYQNVETPWLVTPQAVRATTPIPEVIIETIRGVLVNSGEQGFIQKMVDGELTPGMYQTLTPCFVDLSNGETAGAEYYEQIELLCYMPDDVRTVYEQMINDVMACYFEISDAESFDARQNEDGVEIAFNNIVVGKYGIRAMGNHKWVYGTGLTEPRFTLAVHSVFQAAADAPAASNEQETASVLEPPKVVEMPSRSNEMVIDVDNGHHL
jgi:hypothetical protein